MKSGADDYVPKPFDNDEIRVVVAERALDRYAARAREPAAARAASSATTASTTLIGSGKAMQECVRDDPEGGRDGPHRARPRRERHRQGARRPGAAQHEQPAQRPFVAVNCAAINRELVESELFGHEKGAFTGADSPARGTLRGSRRRDHLPGRDRRHGTPETQAKVLRVLQERSLERVGGNREHRRRRARRSRPPTATSPKAVEGGELPRGSLLPAEGGRRSSSRRCASAAKTCRPSLADRFLEPGRPSGSGATRSAALGDGALARARSPHRGPATCASCAT